MESMDYSENANHLSLFRRDQSQSQVGLNVKWNSHDFLTSECCRECKV